MKIFLSEIYSDKYCADDALKYTAVIVLNKAECTFIEYFSI